MFDCTSDYKNHIEPALNELVRQCQLYGVPMFTTIAYADDGKTTQYSTRMLSSAVSQKKVTQDKFPSLTLIMRGFKAVPSGDVAVMQDGDVSIEM